MVFVAMLQDASQDNDDGIQLKYRTDGGVFNLRRLEAKTKVKVATLRVEAYSCLKMTALLTGTLKRKCSSA